MESLRQDLHQSIRMFARKPALTCVAIATLAIGIGASTAVFSVLYIALLRPLPYPHASRLCVIWTDLGNEGRAPGSGPELYSLRDTNNLFEEVGGIWVQTGALTGKAEPVQVKLGWVTSNFLSMLAPHLQLGRFFVPDEQGSGRAHVVILSHELWEIRYGSDPKLLGQAILLNGQPYTVVGILPAGFRLFFPNGAAVPPEVDVYSPFPQDLSGQPRDQDYVRMIATLRPGIDVQLAQAKLNNLAAQLRSNFHEYSEQDLHLQILPLQQDATRAVRIPLLLLFAGSGLVLLIVCANLAILLLTRASERLSEISLRAALGAKPARIMRQLLTESILLSCTGGGTGVLLSFAILRALAMLEPEGIARNTEIALNLPALCLAVLVSIGSGVLFGLFPAWMAREANLAALLCQNSRSSTDSKHTFRKLLISGEVALTFLLLTSSILLVTTFLDVLRVYPGFQAKSALTFRVSLLGERYASADRNWLFLRDLEQRLSILPGVDQAGFVSHLPLDDALPNWYDYAWREFAPKDEQSTLMADHRAASAGFFDSLGVRFISGRNFDTSDVGARRKVAIIDDVLARQLWEGQTAVGKRINVASQEDGNFGRDVAEVVGVIRHVDSHSLTLPERGQVYLPYYMASRQNIYFVLRVRSSSSSLITLVRQRVAGLDNELPVAALRPMSDYVAEERIQSRFVAILIGALAGIAFLLSSIGTYGITANAVTRRTKEIGIRLALGAKPGHIVRMASDTGLRPVAAGIVAGLGFSFVLTPLLSSLLFEVNPISAPVLSSVIVILSFVGLLAVIIPSVRVLRNNPMRALRCE
ncbi:MAG: ABC transporter permease [Terracidiphilus sp.]